MRRVLCALALLALTALPARAQEPDLVPRLLTEINNMIGRIEEQQETIDSLLTLPADSTLAARVDSLESVVAVERVRHAAVSDSLRAVIDELRGDTIGAPMPSVVTLEGMPDSLIVGDTAAVTGTLWDEAGAEIPTPASAWQVNITGGLRYAGLVGLTNYVRAIAPGPGAVRYTHTPSGLADQVATFIVDTTTTEPPDTTGEAVAAAVSGGQRVLLVGDAVTIRPNLLNADGDVIPTDPSEWTVDFDPAFLQVSDFVTTALAPTAAGSSVIIAYQHDATQLETEADVVILPEAEPGELNEPPGMTRIGSNDGSVKEAGGHAFGINGFGPWSAGNTIEVVNDPTNPAGSGKSLRFRWRPNVHPKAGIARMHSGIPGGPYQEIYVRWRIILEPGESAWDFGHKFFYLAPNKNLASGNTTTDRPSGGTPRPLRMTSYFRAYSHNDANGSTGANRYPIRIGQWFTAEAHYRWNTPGKSDGFARMYFNGELIAQRSNIEVGWTHGLFFDYFEWYGTSNSVPTESFYRLGELYISGKK